MNILKITIPLQFLLTVASIYFPNYMMFYVITLTLFTIINAIGTYDMMQSKHALWKNFPVLGRLRWFAENLRPKIAQYFIENNLNGTPINRENRSLVYQRSKLDSDKIPFGTEHNVYEDGYEFISHSMFPIDVKDISEPRVLIGTKLCNTKYSASIFNISAMSYGALSGVAIEALNMGSKLGNFYHVTGEGGISPYHKKGGDLVFQFGCGYFGCGETIDGIRYFNDDKFLETLNSTPTVKMIEIKLSQGAKPATNAHLPKAKNTEEIALIRGVEPHTDVYSPSYHTAFSTFDEMILFIEKLRKLTNNNIPIGIKLCIGNISEFNNMISTFSEKNSFPDFITLDGSSGGTGSASAEHSNYVGRPLVDALILLKKEISLYDNLSDIKIIVSEKVTNAFDIIKLISLGADVVNAARAFMLSLGCIQARLCHLNTCVTGIATQDKKLTQGLDPKLKSVRVFNYHSSTIKMVRELMGSMAVKSTSDITPIMLNKRIDGKILTFKEIYS